MTSRVMRCCLPACARCQGACLLVLQAHHSHKTHRASQNGYGFRRSMLGIDQVRLALLVNQERTQPLQSLGGRAVRVATAKM
ncbi:hypothetical protein BS78_01G179100 [Paspalum vaginatum]|nr:hypothetical protein BS78_01G179100 [Paspalum vaginatum]